MDKINIITLAAVAILFVWGILLSLKRKNAKSIFRFITVLISAGLALGAVFYVKAHIPETVNEAMIPELKAQFPAMAEVLDKVTDLSPSLLVMLESCGLSIVAPIVFVVTFIAVSIITWVLYAIISLILRKSFRRCKSRRLLACIVGIVQTTLIIIVLMVPVVGYLDLAPVVLERVAESGTLSEEKSQAILDGTDTATKIVSDLNDSIVVKAAKTIGSMQLYRLCTDITLEGHETVHLNDEADAIAKFGCDIYRLYNGPGITEYGPDQAEILLDAAVSFSESELITTISGEIIFSVSEEWMQGKEFWGMAKPDMGTVIDPFVNDMLLILHDDSHNNTNLREDVNTTAKVFSILAQNKTFGHISDTEGLLKNLGNGNVMHDLITTLGANNRMGILVHDITDIGMRAVATALKVPENNQAIYDGFINNTTELLVTLDTVAEEEKVNVISSKLSEEFDRAGVAVDSSIIECFAMVINEDISAMSGETIDSNFLVSLFEAYATASSDVGGSATVDLSYNGGAVASDLSYNGGANYIVKLDGVNEGGYAKNGACVTAFACLIDTVAKNPENDELIEAAVIKFFDTFLAEMDEEKAGAMRAKFIEAFTSAKNIAESHQNLSSLKSAETVNTTLVTVDDIMKATEGAKLDAENIEKEAEAFQNMVNKAGELVELVNKTDENGEKVPVDFQEVAPVMGEILNMLQETPTVGEEATEKLFVSIVQTDTVRESTGITASDAVDIAGGITGDTNDYGKAMETIQVGYDVMDALNSSTMMDIETIERIIQVIDTNNAGVVKDFFTNERLAQYGIKEEKLGSSKELLYILVDNIAVHDATDRAEDVDAVRHLFNLLVVATGKTTSDEDMFGENGKMGDAHAVVYSMLDSALGQETLIEGLTKDGAIDPERVDAFGVSQTFSENDKQILREAVEEYVANAPEKGLEGAALLALFGI